MAEESTDPVVVSGPENRALGLPAHPVLVAAGPDVVERAMEFFAVTIRNVNTRQAYLRALRPFLDYVAALELALGDVQPLHMATYIEQLTGARAPATVKQHLAAIRRFYGWLVTGGLLERNPAADVRGPAVKVRTGKTPVLFDEDCRALGGHRH